MTSSSEGVLVLVKVLNTTEALFKIVGPKSLPFQVEKYQDFILRTFVVHKISQSDMNFTAFNSGISYSPLKSMSDLHKILINSPPV